MAQRVVVGITDSPDSIVSAYLLKKQGYDVCGVSIIFSKDQSGNSFKISDCYDVDVKKINAICHALGISFYAVNSEDDFFHHIIDNFVASRLSGINFFPCIKCSNLKVEILAKKAELLNADYFATGYYAKLNYNKSTNEYKLSCSYDFQNDQSYLLSTIDQDVMKKMLLPLSELRKEEVFKIAKSLDIEDIKFNDKKKEICFKNQMVSEALVERYSPPSLRKPGSIYQYGDDFFLSDHEGIHHFHMGQKSIKSTGIPFDSTLEVVAIVPATRNIYLGQGINFGYKLVALNNFIMIGNTGKDLPIIVFVKINDIVKRVSCTLSFKTNDRVSIYFNDIIQGVLVKGDQFTIYDGDLSKAKVIGSGTVDFVHLLDISDRDDIIHKEQDLFVL